MEIFEPARIISGQKIILSPEDNSEINDIFIGCSWGAAKEKAFWGLFSYTKEIDLDLSCAMFNGKGKIIDHIYSPLYKTDILKKFGLPRGKLASNDGAIRHTGDDTSGDRDEEGMKVDNEVITLSLQDVSPEVADIVFFINNSGDEDFSQIPYVIIRVGRGESADPDEILASFEVKTGEKFSGMKAMIMGRLHRLNDNCWEFEAIGEATNDPFPGYTIHRIADKLKK